MLEAAWYGEMYKRNCRKKFSISCVSDTNRRKINSIKIKLIILVAIALVAVVVAAPPEPPKIIRSEYEVKPEGNYVYAFETEDGIARSETGEVKEILDDEKKPHVVVIQRGAFSYTDPEGKPQVITYYADENGFHAEGDSIPKVSARR